jgi:hypothetical protein
MNQLTGTPKTPHINVPTININKSKVIVNPSSQRTSCSPVIRNIFNANSSATPLITRLDNINPLGLNLSVSLKRKIDFNHASVDVISATRAPAKKTKKPCKCGSEDHSYISHHSCIMNTKRNEPSIFTKTAEVTKKACKCGKSDHSYTIHVLCSLRNTKCICGATDHKTTRHSKCKYNKKQNVIESSAEVTKVNLISQTTNPLLIHARETIASNSQISLAPLFEINV